MKGTFQANSLAKRIVSAIFGRDDLTPVQRAKLAEMEKDYEELIHQRNDRKDQAPKNLKQN